MKPKCSNDNDCDQKFNCHRWNGEGELINIRHGVERIMIKFVSLNIIL